MEIIPLLLLVFVCFALLFGYPVAFTLSGVSILFAIICIPFGIFDISIFKSIPLRIFGIMNNVTGGTIEALNRFNQKNECVGGSVKVSFLGI